jgi:glycogen phosphorylase
MYKNQNMQIKNYTMKNGGYLMYILGKIRVNAIIPEKLKMLEEMAYNLWWSWNPDVIELYKEIDLSLWEELNKNPVKFMQEVSQEKLNHKLKDAEFIQRYEKVLSDYQTYMEPQNTWFSKNHPDKKDHLIAYFSAEYGLNEVLPIYSGGLGVLSGDHCKSASDLGLPFTAIGLFYKQGYFSQHINRDGWQETHFSDLNIAQLPVKPVLDKDGNQLTISVELPGRITYAQIWKVQIGRVQLYLMDTDVPQNSSHDRWLTARLYGGDQETRIQQEIFLGIGGIRVLDALNISPTVYHMNEGHSSFLGLELIRKLVIEKGLDFKQAKEAVSACTVFTTHTPVPAGNDVFPLTMIDKYFSNFWPALGINRHEFLDLGLKVSDHNNFNMTVLALSMAGRKNGVSELHGAVSRNIFNNAWTQVPEEEIPIGHVTNGIHTLTWMSPSIRALMDTFVGDNWVENMHNKEVLKKIDLIPDEELWKTHCVLKTKMIGFLRDKLKQQRTLHHDGSERIREVDTILDSNALTIGFARRFATYKRANLIFRDIARIAKILNKADQPVQIIFAGKAHPADRPAHEIIKHINDIAQQEDFKANVVLIENYNMTLARNLVQGVDVWLNNPRRPLEASGTSGQKVSINGIINFSVLDGWWCEGYNGKNGWCIGDHSEYENEHLQDNADSQSMYDTLENEIIPIFFNRNENQVPTKWVQIMKESMKSILYQYSTQRMVTDYFNLMYLPCMNQIHEITQSNFALSNNLSQWKEKVHKAWPNLQIYAEKTENHLTSKDTAVGKSISLSVQVYLDILSPKEVKVQVYYGKISENTIASPQFINLQMVEELPNQTYRYEADLTLENSGQYGYTFRIIPDHPDLVNPFDMNAIKWIL